MFTFRQWYLTVFAALWLGGGAGWAAETRNGTKVLVDLDPADFVNGADHWPQHSGDTGIPGHFIPRGSPTRQVVAGAPAVVFDGDGDAFTGPLTTGALHAAGAPYTVEVWAFQGNIREQESLVSWGKRGGPDATFAGFRYGADPECGAVGLWGSAEAGYRTVPPAGKWHHLAFVYDGRRLTIYVDGESDSTKEVGTLDAHDTLPVMLGAELGGDRQLEGKFTHFSGALGLVRIHTGALDAAAIQRHCRQDAARFPGLTAQPLAGLPRHRFAFGMPAGDAPEGTAVPDVLGGLVAAVRGGGARFTGAGLRLPGGASNTAAYLDFPNRMVSSQENVTLELWVTQEASLDWGRILSIGTNRAGEIAGPGGGFSGSETLTLFGNVGAAPVNRFARSEGRLLNGGPDRDPADYPASEIGVEFHHAIVYEKVLSEWRWYRNGILMEVIPDADGPVTLDDLNVWLGRSEFSADNNFCGTYREMRVYNRVLAEGEIFGDWQRGPGDLRLVSPVVAGVWRAAGAGPHGYDVSGNWSGGEVPNGCGAVAAIAGTVSGDQRIKIGAETTLGTLTLGARNSAGAFLLEPLKDGRLVMDAGSAGPASLVQLTHAPPSQVAVPLELAAETEIANMAAGPLVLSGLLSGSGTLVKTGPGPVFLTGNSGGFRGMARVLTGSLVLGHDTDAGNLSATRFTVAENAALVVNRRDDCALGPVVDGAGRFSQIGGGTLTLDDSAHLALTGSVDAEDGSGPLVSTGTIDGVRSVRSDSELVLDAHSNTRVREFIGVGFANGGRMTIRDGANVTLAGGEGALNVGDTGAGQSVLALEGGNVFWKELFIGKGLGTSGLLLQTGGDLTRRGGDTSDARVGGAFEGGHRVCGAWRMTGGTFSTDANLQIGAYGLGYLEINGGTAAVKGFLGIGRFQDALLNKSRGLVDVRAGRLSTTAPDRLLTVGDEGIGVLNIREQGTVICSNRMIIGGGTLSAAGRGTVNLSRGGVLSTCGIGQFNPAAANGSLYFDGGVLRAAAPSQAFIEDLDSVTIGPGGAVIDTGDYQVTIGQALLAPTGQGVKSIPVAKGGGGYLAPPLIEISGGGGSGAVAMAELTDGEISALTVINPGTGYTSPPTVAVLGGGAGGGLVAGTVELQANRGGGLRKTGDGVLVLTGDSTYQGGTQVDAGELRVEGNCGSAKGKLEVSRGAVLAGCGRLGGDVRVAVGGTLAPGPSGGSLRVDGGVELRGTLKPGNRANPAGTLEVRGALDLTGARLVVGTVAGSGRDPQVIASYGTLRGRFAGIELPTGFELDYQFGGRNEIALVATKGTNGN